MSPTLGEKLRLLREEKGVSIEQAAQGTHIRLAYLKALEVDERHLLPSTVQGKGFLRVYAGYLGADVQPLLDLWEGKSPAPAGSTELEAAILQPKPQPEPAPEPVVQPPAAPPPPLSAEGPVTASQEMFRQIGLELRRQREIIGMSLADVERFTRLRLHYLAALEDGRIEDMPSPVQGRGMLSNYAHFLHLDNEALLMRFAEALQARRLERAGPPPKASTARAAKKMPSQPSVATLTWRRLLSPDLMIGGTLFILLMGFVIWGSARVIRLNAQTIDVTPPSIAAMLQDTPGFETETVTAGEVPAASPSPPAGGSTEEALDPGSEEGTPATPEGPPVTDASIQVYVVASQRVLLRITADGEVAFNGRTTPGGAYSFSADEQLELLTGNAGGLQVYYQQEDLGTLGGIGDVVSLLFTVEGMITPTAAPTSTAAPTETATLTLEPSPGLPTATITPYLP